MATMTFWEEVKDKTSRIIPTPYSDIVEQATSEILLSPDYEKIMFLCDVGNGKQDQVVDLIRAVRRRIDEKSAKVQYFTIVLLSALVKNCGLHVHYEICDTKGLLKDLVAVAIRKPASDGEFQAKKAALELILGMSLWFSDHPNDKVKPLSLLADACRAAGETFEGVEVDTSVVINVSAPAASEAAGAAAGGHRPSQVRRQRTQQRAANLTRQQQQQHQPQQDASGRVVDAIPIVVPGEEQLSGMMDAVMLLAEYLTDAENRNAALIGDDVISEVSRQVRRDHHTLAELISSGIELENLEVLLSIVDSQATIIQRVATAVRQRHPEHYEQHELHQHLPPTSSTQQGGGEETPPPLPPVDVVVHAQPLPVAPQQHPPPAGGVRTAMDIEEAPPTAAVVAKPMAAPPSPPPAKPPAKPAAPSLDELFGDVGIAQPPPAVAPAPYEFIPTTKATTPPPAATVSAPPAKATTAKAASPPPVMQPHKETEKEPVPAPQEVVEEEGATAQKEKTDDELLATTFEPVEVEPSPLPVGRRAPPPLRQQQQSAPMVLGEAQAAAVHRPHAFPAPQQQMDPAKGASSEEMARTDEPPLPSDAHVTGSLNADEDDFDAFINNRLGGK